MFTQDEIFHKEQNAHNRCRTHQNETESQATNTVNIPFLLKGTFFFSTAYSDSYPVSPPHTYESFSSDTATENSATRELPLLYRGQVHLRYR